MHSLPIALALFVLVSLTAGCDCAGPVTPAGACTTSSDCPTGSTCVDRRCRVAMDGGPLVDTGATPEAGTDAACSAVMCGATCCATGEVCSGGACCASASVCGGACCGDGEVCEGDVCRLVCDAGEIACGDGDAAMCCPAGDVCRREL